MIMDKNLIFCENSALSAGDAASDVIDFGAEGDILEKELVLVAVITEAADGGTSAVFKVETDSSSDFSTKTTLYASDAILTADMTKGKKIFDMKMPRGLKRYARIYSDVTGTFTAGKYSAFLTPGTHVGS